MNEHPEESLPLNVRDYLNWIRVVDENAKDNIVPLKMKPDMKGNNVQLPGW